MSELGIYEVLHEVIPSLEERAAIYLSQAAQKAERSELLDGIRNEEADVIFTSYPLLRRDVEL